VARFFQSMLYPLPFMKPKRIKTLKKLGTLTDGLTVVYFSVTNYRTLVGDVFMQADQC